MKRFLLLLLCCSFALIADAQLRLAVTGGPHSAGIEENNNIPDWQNKIQPGYSNRTTFHFGFLGDIPLSKRWSVQPAILYTGKGRKFSMIFSEEEYQFTDTMFKGGSFFPNYIEIPVNLTHKIPLGKKTSFFLSAGPYIGFFYNGKSKDETRLYFSNVYKSQEEDIEAGSEKNMVSTLDYGLNFKGGFEFNSFFISGFYSYGLKDFYQADYSGSFKHRVTGASIGIWLNKKDIPVKDKDGDGIPDDRDNCPDQPGTELTGGCPDADGDGIPDREDKCPDIPGTLKYNGCPVPDSDNDGINDEEDKCPTVPGLAKYNGCPVPDTDGDGINDEEDECPAVPGLAKYKGCPIPDTDGDGVNDEEDECPDIPGPASNNGCPEISKEVTEKLEKAAGNIYFRINSAELTVNSYKGLDEVIEVLQKNKDLKLEINGHTDNSGRSEYNKTLSQQRADAVKKYLTEKGISVDRLKSTGYGDERPLVENSNEENRAKNRRVELILRHNFPESRRNTP